MAELSDAHTLRDGVQCSAVHQDLTHLTHEPDLVTKLMGKRQSELERRARLFDTRRMRWGGADPQYLDAQIEEKQQMAAYDRTTEQIFSQNALMTDEVAQAVEQLRQEAAREKEMSTKAYSSQHLRQDMRREYALSDPDHLKKDRPARVGDDDPRCGVASMQKFDGEWAADKKMLHGVQREWCLDQIAEHEAQAQAEREEKQRNDEAVIDANHVRGLIEQATRDQARANKLDETNCNLALAGARRSHRKDLLQKEAEAVHMHATNVALSDRMTEKYDAQRGLDGRLIRDEYKRLSVEQEQAVYDANARQVLEKRAQQRAAGAAEYQHSEQTQKQTVMLTAIQQEQKRLEVERRRLLDGENAVIAQAQRNQQSNLGRTYANHVDDGFFGRFNASAR